MNMIKDILAAQNKMKDEPTWYEARPQGVEKFGQEIGMNYAVSQAPMSVTYSASNLR